MADINMDELQKMKVADLKKELKERGLTVSGTKAELIDRLQGAIGDESAADDTGSIEASIDQLVEDKPAKPVPAKVPAEPSKAKENVQISAANSSTDHEEKKIVSLKGLSEADRLKARAEKFGGALSDAAKKQMRAERFGVSATSATKPLASGGGNKISTGPASAEDVEKLKKRAERFGATVSGKLSEVDEEEKKRKRMERFGMVTAPSEPKKVKLSTTTAPTNSDLEEKKRKRAERFGLT